MSDENQIKEVLIEREGRVFRWGESEYLRHWNGFKFTLNTAVFKTFAFPIALAVGALTFFLGRKEEPDFRAKEVNSPGISNTLPIIEPKIMVEKDLFNVIKKEKVEKSPMGRIQVFNLRSTMEIPVGSEARAILDSGASNGIVKARLLAPVVVDRDVVLPEGVIVFGRGKSTEERLFVEFQKAVLPSGETVAIRAQAFDIADKILGLKGALVGTKTKKMLMGAGMGVVGGMLDSLDDTSGTYFSMERKKSVRSAALAGASKAALDQSQAYLDDTKNSPTIIEVKQGTELYVIFTDG